MRDPRPSEVEPVVLVVRVSERLNDDLVAYCIQTDTSPSNVIAVAVRRWLEVHAGARC